MNDLNIRPESINLQEDTGTKSLDIGFGKESSDQTTKCKANKSKNKQVEQHQTEIFHTAKETIRNLKGHSPNKKKISANHMCDKRLISKYTQHSYKSKQKKNCIKNGGNT